MTKHDKFALKLADLSALIGDSVSADRIDMIAELLSEELSDEEFLVAVRLVAMKETRLPPPVRFLELAKGQSRDKAEVALGRVFDAIRSYGSYNPLGARQYLGQNIWNVIKRMGGWDHICKLDHDQLNTYRAQFLNCAEKTINEIQRSNLLALPQGKRQELLDIAFGESKQKQLGGGKSGKV
jgi:hypothetical protein